VAYTPDWEPLADALKRVMATGIDEDEAKADLCRAVADRKIVVRVRTASDYGMRGQVFSDGNVGVPAHLRPGDLDWVQSRPGRAQWSIGPKLGEHYSWISGWENRPLDLIEVSTADVIAILCGGAGANDRSSATAGQETAAINALASHLKSNPQLKRAEAAAWCKASGYNVSDRGFQSRVWPKARAQADLPARALPGRKGKSSR
jgi:hypothetical protein